MDSRTNEVVEMQTNGEIALFVKGIEPIAREDDSAIKDGINTNNQRKNSRTTGSDPAVEESNGRMSDNE